MNRFCGGEFRVAKRVETIVDEASGRMLTMKNRCIVLDGVTSGGEYRGLYPQNELIFWREVWLERVGKAQTSRSRQQSNQRRNLPEATRHF